MRSPPAPPFVVPLIVSLSSVAVVRNVSTSSVVELATWAAPLRMSSVPQVMTCPVAVAAVLHPELFRTEELSGDLETTGELTSGMTVFDRRPNQPQRTDIEVALEVDIPGVTDCIVRSLAEAGRQSA